MQQCLEYVLYENILKYLEYLLYKNILEYLKYFLHQNILTYLKYLECCLYKNNLKYLEYFYSMKTKKRNHQMFVPRGPYNEACSGPGRWLAHLFLHVRVPIVLSSQRNCANVRNIGF